MKGKFLLSTFLGFVVGCAATFYVTKIEGPQSHKLERRAEDIAAAAVESSGAGGNAERLFDDPSSPANRIKLESYIAQLSRGEMPGALARVLELKPSGLRSRLLSILFKHWGSLEPSAALTAAKSLLAYERTKAEASALEGWAEKEPEIAWGEAKKLIDSVPTQGSLFFGVLRHLARADWERGVAAATSLPTAALRESARDHISEAALEKGDVSRLLKEIGNLNGQSEQNAWISSVFERWGMYESDGPFEAIKSLEPTLAKTALIGTLQGWSRSDPLGAIDFALERHQEADIKNALGPMLQTALRNVPEGDAMAVVTKLSDYGILDASAPGFILALAQVHPSVAAGAAVKLNDPNQRAIRLSQVLATWSRNSPEAAATYYESAPAKEKTASVFATMAMHSLQNNVPPERVFGWLDGFAGDDRIGAMNALIGGLEAGRSPVSSATAKALSDVLNATPNLPNDAKHRVTKIIDAAK